MRPNFNIRVREQKDVIEYVIVPMEESFEVHLDGDRMAEINHTCEECELGYS
jgi:hypothetical protein